MAKNPERTLAEALAKPPVYKAGGFEIQVKKFSIKDTGKAIGHYVTCLEHVVHLHGGVPEDEAVIIESMAVILMDQVFEAMETPEGEPVPPVVEWFGTLTDAGIETIQNLDHAEFAGLVKAIFEANRGPFALRHKLFARHIEIAMAQAMVDGETPTSPPDSTE